jgi:hypothetical protein
LSAEEEGKPVNTKNTHALTAVVAVAGLAAAGGGTAYAVGAHSTTPYPAVQGLRVTSTGQGSATFKWNPDHGASGSTIRVLVYNASTAAKVSDTDVRGSATGATVTGLPAGTALDVKVGVNGSASHGASPWTKPVLFYTVGATGPKGATGPAGPAGTPILYESTGTSTPDLAIDMAPGPDGSAGSGGWGWDSSANKPVTDLAVGKSATFTVTIVQPNTETADGSITLTYDPYDFKLVTLPADGTCTTITMTSQETCSFTDLAHSATSKPFVLQALHANPDAVIGVSAVVAGEEATAFFPVQISAAS